MKQHKVAEDGRTILSNWAFVRHGELLIVCSRGSSEPPAADFEQWIARLGKHDYTKLLVVSEGGEPSSKQRARVAEFWRGAGHPLPKTAVLTDSVVTRGVLTALQWLLNTSDTKCLPLRDLEGALMWLQFQGSVAEVSASIRGLQAALEMRRTG